MKTTRSSLSIQKWGNSLAVRIPVAIARRSHFEVGTPVELVVQKDGVVIRVTGNKVLTLAERLEKFDPKLHGHEVMATNLVGEERFE